MKVTEFLSPNAVLDELHGSSKHDVLRELSERLAQAYGGTLRADRVLEVLGEREKLASTGIGEGVAIPHGKMPGLDRLYAAFGVSHSGVDFASIDKRPTQIFFALVAPENSAGVHLKALARISRLFRGAPLRDAILAAHGADDIYRLIAEEDARA
ncbi:MAG TPA: PTS sugar transporter subunit IIA [Myxococcaceae bacterium]|nr:PTS sugar transporter subunit IIA [Myxococcaceae bacterium]